MTPETIDYTDLPEHDQGAVQRWIEHGIDPGHFLSAVLRNDLIEACNRADLINQQALFVIVRWFNNNAPSPCWGSPAKVDAWRERTRAKP